MASDLADVLFTEITGGDAATATDDESTDKENGEDAREADASSKGGDKDGEKGKMKECEHPVHVAGMCNPGRSAQACGLVYFPCLRLAPIDAKCACVRARARARAQSWTEL